jgi:hypothetical protein
VWAGIYFRTADVQGAVLGNKVAHYFKQHYSKPVERGGLISRTRAIRKPLRDWSSSMARQPLPRRRASHPLF